MKRHAYLIEAHNNFKLLYRLLEILDDKRNDIYIHIDKKTKKVPFEYLKGAVRYSKVYFINRIKVTWGGYSQIKCELNLLKVAVVKHYEYYHLMSGVDLPIKTQDEIHSFFEKNAGCEFVDFAPESFNKKVKYRYSIFHIFQDICGKNTSILTFTEKLLVKLQIILGFPNRTKKNKIKFCAGSNWWSITDDLAQYIISKEKDIEKIFKHSLCCDEIFIQTLVYNSKFYNRVYKSQFHESCLRYIDWKRGNPYVFKYHDFNELINSGCLFARKFGTNTDEESHLVEKVYHQVINK